MDGEVRTAFPSLVLLGSVFRGRSRGRVGLSVGGVIRPVWLFGGDNCSNASEEVFLE